MSPCVAACCLCAAAAVCRACCVRVLRMHGHACVLVVCRVCDMLLWGSLDKFGCLDAIRARMEERAAEKAKM